MLPYKELTISCHTNPDIPPPYAHTYHIVVDENPSYLTLSFKLRYTEREDLTEDEILDEGFSADDDFIWSGKLNKVWKQHLDAMTGDTKLYPSPAASSDYAIELISKGGGSEGKGFVSKKETQRWIYFIQELKQAILESERIEAPLTIEYLKIEENAETNVVLNGNFADRTFTVRVDRRPVEQFDWSVLQRTINLIFNETEIDPEEQLAGRPREEGYYLLLPGSGWYQLEVGVRARYDDTAILENIIKTMESFIEGS